jgi:hypothetical protein
MTQQQQQQQQQTITHSIIHTCKLTIFPTYIYINFLSSISVFSERQTYASSSKDHYQRLR